MKAVLLHGLGGSAFDWEAAARLCRVDCHPLNLPFHGGRPLDRPVTFLSLVDDVVSYIDSLKEDVVIGGISIGCAVGIECAARLGPRVPGLLLVAPVWLDGVSGSRLSPVTKFGKLLLRRGLSLARDVALALPPVAAWTEADRKAFAARFSSFDPEALGTAMVTLSQERPLIDLRGASAQSMTVSVIGWHHDGIHTIESAQAFAELLGASFLRTMSRPQLRQAEALLLAEAVEELAFAVADSASA